jgi:hypothetical protein
MFSFYESADNNELEPTEFYLSPNYPNPFSERTTIKYCIAYKTKVILTVYDSDGKELKILVDKIQNPGTYEVEFNVAQDSSPVKVKTIYFYQLEADNFKCEKKMELIK